MKTLYINGSPRKNGFTKQLLKDISDNSGMENLLTSILEGVTGPIR